MQHRLQNKTNARSSFDYQPLEPRQLLAGDVGISVRSGNLLVTGDNQSNLISISADASGGISIEGNETLINGSSSAFQFDGNLKNVTLRMLGGDDQVTVAGLQLSKKLLLDLGRGNDRLQLANVSGRDLTVSAGSGNDIIDIEALSTSRTTKITTNGGDDVLSVVSIMTGRDFRVFTGSGNDTFCVDSLEINGQLHLDLGRGDDELMFAGEMIANGKTNLHLGSGDDLLAMVPATNGQSAVLNDRLKVFSGSGNDRVALDSSVTISRPVKLIGNSGSNDLLQNNAVTLDSVRDRAFESNLTNDQLNQSVNSVYEHLDNAGISPAPFGAAVLMLDPETQRVTVNDPTPTISVVWDQAAQDAVANLATGPTIGSRAYAMVHTAMYDAWSAYDGPAISTVLDDTLQRPETENTDAHKQHAMSFAAHSVLSDLFPTETEMFDALMVELGYNPANETTDVTTPAGIGNRMAAELLAIRHEDGSNQLGDDPGGTLGVPYSSPVDYQPVNQPDNIVEIDAWTPERVPIDAEPGTEDHIQSFLTPQWGTVTPFALESGDQFRPTAPEPFLLVDGTVDLNTKTITVTGESPVAIDRSLIGTIINPAFIAQAEQVVEFSANLNDQQKMIAEFWEDGGGTSFPPGTWMTFGQLASARDNHNLDDDAKMFFALGNAVFDAGIATWESKTFYDYARPVRVIRELGELGLIGEFDSELGGYAIDAWMPEMGTTRILANQFLTYQTPGSDPSPPFAEYTSGHSAFSAAAAEVLKQFTGSDEFGAKVTFQPGESRFEPVITPTESVTLAWPTFTAAAAEAGISRLYGGIHFSDGDINGRTLGRHVGLAAWEQAYSLFNGGTLKV